MSKFFSPTAATKRSDRGVACRGQAATRRIDRLAVQDGRREYRLAAPDLPPIEILTRAESGGNRRDRPARGVCSKREA